jgi:hypothetical protein
MRRVKKEWLDCDPVRAFEYEQRREDKANERLFQKWLSKKMAEVRAIPMPLTEAFFAKNPPAK